MQFIGQSDKVNYFRIQDILNEIGLTYVRLNVHRLVHKILEIGILLS